MSFQQMLLGSAPGFISGATLDMLFANNMYRGATPAELTVSRALAAYAEDTSGNWTSFASGAPRITNRGILIEEGRTNSIRNNSMQGAVAGTQGTAPTNWSRASVIWTTDGLNYTIVGVGTENGVDYIDIRVNGTPSNSRTGISIATFDGATTIAALSGQTWAGSAFVKIAGGSTTNVTEGLLISEHDAGGTFLTASTLAFVPTATLTRIAGTRTLNNASTAFVQMAIVLNYTNGLPFDITLRIGWPQLEQGTFATSPIRTTSAAVARPADNVSLLGAEFSAVYGTPTAITVYLEYSDFRFGSGPNAGLAYLFSDTNNYVGFWGWTGSPELPAQIRTLSRADNPTDVIYGSAGAALVSNGSPAIQKIATSVSATVERAAAQGLTLAAGPQPTVFPTLNALHLRGTENGSNTAVVGSKYIRRFALIPALRSAAELQALTAL